MNKKIAECVGLWLAEGDNKTKREITFTNNCFELISFFHQIVQSLYKGKNTPRLYIYSPSNRKLLKEFNNIVIKQYMDRRANRTYYIYRIADVNFVKEWKRIVDQTKKEKRFFADILRGFFAGEGNVKHDFKNNNSRSLRIAAKKREPFIDSLLSYFEVPIKFDSKKRQYWICGRNIEKLADIGIAELHPEKEAKLIRMTLTLKEKHLSPYELKKLISEELTTLVRRKDLATKFIKSDARILEVLRELRDEGQARYVKMKGGTFWASKELIDNYLNKEKIKILEGVMHQKSMRLVGKSCGLHRKGVSERLEKFKMEGVVYKKDQKWMVTSKGRTILGIDESGSEF